MGDVADDFAKKIPADTDAGINPLTEEELFARIETSVAQADRGEYRNAEEFEAEFDAELKAAYNR